ncbi:hypothetical protein Tco_0606621, partial [Tanacetum coccineum]
LGFLGFIRKASRSVGNKGGGGNGKTSQPIRFNRRLQEDSCDDSSSEVCKEPISNTNDESVRGVTRPGELPTGVTMNPSSTFKVTGVESTSPTADVNNMFRDSAATGNKESTRISTSNVTGIKDNTTENKVTGNNNNGVQTDLNTSNVGLNSGSTNLSKITPDELPLQNLAESNMTPNNASEPRLYNENNVESLFGVKFTSRNDIDVFSTNIEKGKYVEILSTLSKNEIDDVVYAIESIGKKLDNANPNVTKQVVEPSHDDPVVHDVSINTKSTSYAGAAGAVYASAKDQLKVSANFLHLVNDPVFDGVNISIPCKVVEKKWLMDTRLLKEELTRILIWVKLHDVLIQVFEEDEADLVDVVTIGIPSLKGEDFTKEIIRVEYEWSPPRCDVCKIFGHVHDQYPKKVKKKGKAKSTNGSQFVGPTVKQNFRYEPKAATSQPKKVATTVGNASKLSSKLKSTDTSSKEGHITTSNSYSALDNEEDEDEEQVENVYDESTNLFLNLRAGESSSFTAGAG